MLKQNRKKLGILFIFALSETENDMRVLKFGGTSVKNAENILKVVSIINREQCDKIIVVSALGGITNLLIETAQKAKEQKEYQTVFEEIKKRHYTTVKDLELEINPILDVKFEALSAILKGIFLIGELTDKTLAKISSFGEDLSSVIIYHTLLNKQISSHLMDAKKIVKTEGDSFLNAKVSFKNTIPLVKKEIQKNDKNNYIIGGFIASNKNDETATLGRGGSDYTAAVLANIVDANILEIWTDVSGLYTANPKLVTQAKVIDEISYQEAMELSHFGAKVIYPPTIQPVLEKNIPIYIKNTFKPEDAGTRIASDVKNQNIATGISNINEISLITLEGNAMVGVPGFSSKLFYALAEKSINVKLITQASSEHSICIAIDTEDVEKAKKTIDKAFELEILTKKVNPLSVETNLSIIALVGDNMKAHQGISGKMFMALGKNNVNIRAIAQGASENNISVVIAEKNVKKALNSLHECFFETAYKTLNLFIIGVGNVGSIFLKQLQEQQDFLLKELRLKVNVIALANSRKMTFNETGISLSNWKNKLENGKKSDLNEFFNTIKQLNLRNSIFVDNTANENVPEFYKFCLSNSISVVASNKIACSDSYKKYLDLKQTAKEYNTSFLYETNVGAGLPVIDTLKNLISSGDKITKIQAVLSGSLNFIFNNFNEKISFYNVVEQAKEEGYTEPDPRIDLSGKDVMRKILILARESGYALEFEMIKNKSFLPEKARSAKTVSEFMEILKQEENYFQSLYTSAKAKNKKLKYVAEFTPENTKISLEEVGKNHPFYNIEGKDNIVLFYTQRYAEQPLIIKGAGAGAEVTASGIFADVIRLAKD